MVVVKAKVLDPTHLELSRPITVRHGGTVFVALADEADPDAERQDWLSASASSLCNAYSQSEPDYSDSMVRERNPEYGK